MYSKAEASTLLERFKENPLETRQAVRVELGWYDELAAEMFALEVFVSDGLLQIKDTTTTTPAARFFSIARRLPLEIQMVCFRQVGSTKEIIPGKANIEKEKKNKTKNVFLCTMIIITHKNHETKGREW